MLLRNRRYIRPVVHRRQVYADRETDVEAHGPQGQEADAGAHEPQDRARPDGMDEVRGDRQPRAQRTRTRPKYLDDFDTADSRHRK